jgi:hypothetical protein
MTYSTVGLLETRIPIVFAMLKTAFSTILVTFAVNYGIFYMFAAAMTMCLIINCFFDSKVMLLCVYKYFLTFFFGIWS